MKKSLLLLLLPFLCGCSEKEEPIGGPVIGPTYLIARYVEGDMKLDYIPRTAATDGKSNTLYIDWADTEEYYNPDMEKYNLGRQEFWTPENKAKYLEIAKRNGDEIGAYEGGTPPGLYFGDQIALADNFTSMHITSDADWDEEHPAGKPLDDLFRVSVRSWKQRDEYGAPLLCRERMDRIGPEHLQMIPFNPKNPWDGRKNLRPIEIEPLAEPASEQHHRLTLTMTTTDRREQVTSGNINCCRGLSVWGNYLRGNLTVPVAGNSGATSVASKISGHETE